MFRSLLKLLLFAVLLGIVAVWDFGRQLSSPIQAPANARFEIAAGQSFDRVVERLANDGFLPTARSAQYLRVYARANGLGGRIHAGEYALDPSMTVSGVVDLFVSGRTVLHEVRLLEGWTYRQALDEIRRHPQIRQTLTGNDPATIAAAIGLTVDHPEGRLFPDTYRFSRNTSDIELLRKAAALQARVLDEEWQNRAADLPYATPDEALIMASIVEKETGLSSERGQIAGVFFRRLKLGMRLQTDPTVIYGLGERFDGNLRLVDLRTDTPYNTYTRSGMPPTPICLPGRESIRAALHPEDGKTLFFVSRGDGSHVFSETLDQHNAAVRRYQLKQP
jgi:UPF0755 protein